MRSIQKLLLVGLVLVALGSCSDDVGEAGEERREHLGTLLLTGAEIDGLDLGLEPLSSYSVDEESESISEELQGPVDRASASVVRSWALDPPIGSDGVPFVIVSTVMEFSSPADAGEAFDAIFAGVASAPEEIGNVRYAIVPPEGGTSVSFAATRTESTLQVASASFDGSGDEAVLRSLAELLTTRGR